MGVTRHGKRGDKCDSFNRIIRGGCLSKEVVILYLFCGSLKKCHGLVECDGEGHASEILEVDVSVDKR
jgi:hypothetical protein